MKTSSSNAWWRELGAISRGMMFIEGHIATPLALEAARPAPHRSRPCRPPAKASRAGFSLYEDLLFLGGRPMTAGHNDDIDEPFPQTGDGAIRVATATGPRGENAPRHSVWTRKSGNAAGHRLLQGLVMLVLGASVWAFSIGSSGPSLLGAASRVGHPPAAVRPALPLDASASRIIDLPAVTVRPTPEDYALLAAGDIRSDECLVC